MDTGVDALDQMTTAVGQLKWVTAEMAAEMLTASTALAKASSGAHKASDALDSSKQGLEQISKGLDDLIASLPGKDDSGLSSAISTILGGYSSVSGDAVDRSHQNSHLPAAGSEFRHEHPLVGFRHERPDEASDHRPGSAAERHAAGR